MMMMMMMMTTRTKTTPREQTAHEPISSDAKEMVWSHELDPINTSILGFQPERG